MDTSPEQSCSASNCWKLERCTNSLDMFTGTSTLGTKLPHEQKTKPHSEEQRGKRTCALILGGSISKLLGGAAGSTADHRSLWTAALVPRSSCRGTHPTESERRQHKQRGEGVQRGTKSERTGRSETGRVWLPHVGLAPMSAPRTRVRKAGALGCSGRCRPCLAAKATVSSSWVTGAQKNVASCSTRS